MLYFASEYHTRKEQETAWGGGRCRMGIELQPAIVGSRPGSATHSWRVLDDVSSEMGLILPKYT